MEMLIIGLVALAAFAAVLFPLFRRRPGIGDEREFENVPPATGSPPPAASEGGAAAESTAAAQAAPTSEGAAAAQGAPASEGAAPSEGDAATDGDAVEFEVLRYRAAVRAGTVCGKCGQANPAGSAYCFECGARLPVADAKEFE
ncbi:MAG: hypothetical protein ACRELT_06920 [Longimicrobiales bacterium]